MKPRLLQLYRLAVLTGILLIVRQHHLERHQQGRRPVTLEEVRRFLPAAHRLRAEDSARQGMVVSDAKGARIGYLVRSAPQADRIFGYAGPADTLVVFDAEDRVAGIHLKHSYDTPSHIEDVVRDRYFMQWWKGKTWDELAAMDLKAAGVEGVSGATRTSLCMAEGLVHRLAWSEQQARPPPFRAGLHDLALLLIVVGGLLLSFGKFKRKRVLRRNYQLVVLVYLGLISGDLLAQSLFAGWAESGLPWRFTPGLVLLALAALAVPWATRQPMYCAHICPHGAAQEGLSRLASRLKLPRWKPPAWMDPVLRGIPFALLGLVLLTSLLALPLDLAGIEPFDAWIFRSAGMATLCVAGAGLLVSLFVPMAYCHYGCPTGGLLRFVRSRGGADRFQPGDYGAALLLLLALLVARNHEAILRRIVEASWL